MHAPHMGRMFAKLRARISDVGSAEQQVPALQRLWDDIGLVLARNERLLVVAASTFIMSLSHTALRPVMPTFVKACPLCTCLLLLPRPCCRVECDPSLRLGPDCMVPHCQTCGRSSTCSCVSL